MPASCFSYPVSGVSVMQWIVLAAMGVPCVKVMRRIRWFRSVGREEQAWMLYRAAAWVLGLTVYGAMAVQEGVLMAAGMLNWKTGLPLHLCSMMGVLTLPMLIGGLHLMWDLSLYLGLPGAVLALLFPAVLPTPWPMITKLSFYVLHAGLILAPLMSLSLGRRPSPWGAAVAGCFLLVAGLAVMAVNERLDSNYLFVSWAVPGTPLEILARWGMRPYRMLLAGMCAAVLAAESAGVCILRRIAEKRPL